MIRFLALMLLVANLALGFAAQASVLATGARETAEYILQKFGKRFPAQTADEVAQEVSRATARHGSDANRFLRAAGHSGLQALEQAGPKGPDVIKLYLRKGDDAVWLVSKPEKLVIFLKHGDNAADALVKHPGVADALITRHGAAAADALNRISQQSAQRLGMLSQDGLLTATPRSAELLGVIPKYGDAAMDFIWKNKGALMVAAVLGSFLADPGVYISGVRGLAEAVPGKFLESLGRSNVFGLILGGILILAIFPFLAGSVRRGVAAWRARGGR
ncbi:MAG: hypothetical protein ACOVPA_00375 [Rubrivivax sp.]